MQRSQCCLVSSFLLLSFRCALSEDPFQLRISIRLPTLSSRWLRSQPCTLCNRDSFICRFSSSNLLLSPSHSSLSGILFRTTGLVHSLELCIVDVNHPWTWPSGVLSIAGFHSLASILVASGGQTLRSMPFLGSLPTRTSRLFIIVRFRIAIHLPEWLVSSTSRPELCITGFSDIYS